MIKNAIIGIALPILLVGVGVGTYMVMQPPQPPKVPPLGTDNASLFSIMPAASVLRVHALAEKSETLDIPVNGTVIPYREIELAAEAAGRIIEKDPAVRNGSFVKKGQVLLKIDPRDYELDVKRLQRRRDQELASVEELKQDIENSKRLVEFTEEEFKLADDEVKRIQSLNKNFASVAEIDQAKRARLNSSNQRITLQNQIRSFESKMSRLELAAKLAETELEQAQLNLERTIVRAPVAGRIVSERVEADSYVQRGATLLTIEDTEKVEVVVNLRMDQLYWILDQADLSADQLINAAQASSYTLPQIPVKVRYNLSGREGIKYEWRGKLDRYDGAGLDPQSRTIPVRILVEEPENYEINGESSQSSVRSGPPTLVRGMFVEVDIQARPATQLLLVPKLGIKPATGTYRIWKFDADEKAFEAVQEKNAKLFASAAGTPGDATSAKPATAKEPTAADERKTELDPTEWQAGFLRVLDGIQVVVAYDGEEEAIADNLPGDSTVTGPEPVEYWICEVNDDELSSGDFVIVTPIAGIEGNGTDVIRVKKSELQ